jgi:bacterioferritin
VNENKKDPMEVDAAIDALNGALRLQWRSALAYTHMAGTLVGFQFRGLAAYMRPFALAELDDARRLVEKIATLGGEPTVEIAPIERQGDSEAVVRWLIDAETETIEALQDVIPSTGQEGRSEALEHRLEHIIMRKQ